MSSNQPDPSVIKIFGKCLDQDGGKIPTGKKCLLKFRTSAPDGRPSQGELKVGLTFTVDGNGCKPDIQWSQVVDTSGEGADDPLTATAYFVPLKTGPQKIYIRYNGKKLKQADPLILQAVGSDVDVVKALSKV